MAQQIIDLNAMKYRNIHCQNCGNECVEINNVVEDEWGEKVTEYSCKNCEDVFVLTEEYTTYEEGAIDEDEWYDLTEDMKCMLGIDEDYE